MKININKATVTNYKTIDMREPLVEDMMEAQKHGADFAAALISQICTFDGQTLTVEDVKKLRMSVFLDLQSELTAAGLVGSPEALSRLSGMAASPTTA